MKVKTLIDQLQNIPTETEVVFRGYDHTYFSVDSIGYVDAEKSPIGNYHEWELGQPTVSSNWTIEKVVVLE